MSAFDKRDAESARKLAEAYREDVRWHIAKARKERERGDLEAARWHLSRARVWRVNAHHWARQARAALTEHEAEIVRRNRKATEEIRYRLADNLKRLREARGYTQERLAKLCQLQKTYISNVEQATVNITLANLEALATGLGCSEAELLRRQR